MNLALLIASVLGLAVQGLPNISSNIKQLIADAVASVNAIVKSGVTTPSGVSAASIYAAIDGVLSALMLDPNLPKDKLALLASLNDAVQAALAADKQAQTTVDPTKIQPISTV